MNGKKLAAEKAVEHIRDGMTIGLGTGSTAYWAIQKIGLLVQEGLRIQAVATSVQTERLAREVHIPMTTFAQTTALDLCIDGADEVDAQRNLIKGGGGALLREKIVAYNSKQFIVVVDESKLVQHLGKFPLPIEVLPFSVECTLQHIQKLGSNCTIRLADGQPFITDNGHHIIDAHFYPIVQPNVLNSQLHQIPGVMETGLFLNEQVSNVIIGCEDGAIKYL